MRGLPGSFPTTPPLRFGPVTPPPSGKPPPVPEKSPKRLRVQGQRGGGDGSVKGHWVDEALAAVELKKVERDVRESQSVPADGRGSKGSPTKGGALGDKSIRRQSGSFNGRVEKSAAVGGRRSSAAAYVQAAVEDMKKMKTLHPPPPPRRATDSELQTKVEPVGLSAQERSWKRRQKGETMSMLLNDGFFPVQTYLYSNKNPNISVRVPFPPPLSLLNKDLPDTPSSIVPTPTEMYQASPAKSPRPTVRQRKAGSKRRSPLAPVAVTDAKAYGTHLPPAGVEHELSPSRLSAIPEGSSLSENTPSGSASGVSTPLATKIHLRGGSVITLSPPELTAWKQTYYLQGPIKLPKPTILPRKGSTASMEAFQEVVDQVYQEALNIPRRRSDDQIVDDICEFFDEFCFTGLCFGGDVLGVLDVKAGGDEMEDIIEEIDEMNLEIERFTTPPQHEVVEATPVEKVLAKEVVEHTISLPPVETEEALRARGIARLSQGAPSSPTPSRGASATSRKDSAALPLLPVPETSMLDVPPTPALLSLSKSQENIRAKERPRAATGNGMDQGFDWDDDVEELDALSAWIAPAAIPKRQAERRNLPPRESNNPIKRMRRFVATASAIL